MKTLLSHIQLNIDFRNVGFYKELMAFLGWSPIFEMQNVIGFTSGTNGDIWFLATESKEHNNYDHIGVNHIAFKADSQADVDRLTEHLKAHHIPPLFETPRHRPEFSQGEDATYYQVMFETPDKQLFELIYTGPKQ